MHNHFVNGFLAAVVLVFAIFGWSNEVVIVGAALLLIYSIVDCSKSCSPKKEEMPKKPAKKKK
ncbi:MAG: hypothetical protein Q8Q04_00470 [archaeon]|nr:hypothetical protein [archaeon]